MTDIVSLVLDFPGIVSGLVDTWQKVQEYRNLEKSHKSVVNRAVHATKKLVRLVEFIDVKSMQANTTAAAASLEQELIEEALLYASDAMVTVVGIVEGWTLRLRIDTNARGRMFMARLATAVAEKMMRKHNTIALTRFNRSAVGKLASEVAYLATGCRQMKDAIQALEKWTAELHDILISSQQLRLVRNPRSDTGFFLDDMKDVDGDLLFVTRSRERSERNIPVQRIAAADIRVYQDIDPVHPTGFYVIEEGRYMGCIIDRRDMNYLYSLEKDDQAVAETDRIARVFCEERSGTTTVTQYASIGVLPCCGWAETSSSFMSREHDLVFRPPPGMRRPRTLRMLLLDGPPRHSLEVRLKFCVQLATSVLLVHSLKLVHKDIRPDSILVFEPLKAKEENLFPMKLGCPYLANFNRARSEDIDTVINPFKQSPHMRILYTHPVHTTSAEHVRYEMRNDIYSLGVVLIEIALWKSLFRWSDRREGYDADFSYFDFSIEKYKRKFMEMGQPEYRNRGWALQWDLIQLVEREIPAIMGTKFKNVVVSCLEFGEKKKPTQSESVLKVTESEYHPQEESVVFVQKVLKELRGLAFS